MIVYQEQVEQTPRLLAPVKTNCAVTMHYFGPNLNLSSSLFADADEVVVEQQPAGCGSVNIFREVVQRGSKYSSLMVKAADWLNFNPCSVCLFLHIAIVLQVRRPQTFN